PAVGMESIESEVHMRGWRIGFLCAAMVLACGASLAHAQLQAISECVSLGHMLFCEQDVAAIDKAAGLSAEQKEAVSSLMHGAMLRARTVQGRFNRFTGDKWEALTDTLEGENAYQEACKKYQAETLKQSRECTRQIAAIERETLADIRAVLRPAQIEKG